MDESHHKSAEWMRSQIQRELHTPLEFRAALLSVPPAERDAWLDSVLELRDLPDDGPDLPRGCVPYFPCSVDALLRMVDQADVRASDVFVDVGSGVGRTAAFVHLLTGAGVIAIEIQSGLVLAARELATRMLVSRVSCIEGDAVGLTGFITIGSVFFLYCPFSGERLAKVLGHLEAIARTKTIRVCCVDLPLPPCPWLSLERQLSGDLTIYRSTRGGAPSTGTGSCTQSPPQVASPQTEVAGASG
ncbi:MAG TPA: class I SAM-dependent methyltransferase [Polyangiaceae bacterium]|nr:class I SAM-dependent methyltransferase [Polyangiaceae bacterium]